MKNTVLEEKIENTINSELLFLKRDTRFYDWRTRSILYEQMSDLLELIRFGVKDSGKAVDMVVRFLKLDKYICLRCDDSDDGITYEFNFHAIDVLVPFAKEYEDKDKLAEYVFQLLDENDYGCHDGLLDRGGEILPEEKIRELIKRQYISEYSTDYIYEGLACALNDAPLLISLLESTEHGIRSRDYEKIARCFLKSGNPDDALQWALKMPDGFYNEEILEEIYKRKGDKDSLQKLYEDSYIRFPSKKTAEKIVSLCGTVGFQEVKNKKIEAIKKSVSFYEGDMEFLLDQNLIKDAETYLYNRRNQVNGVYLSSTFIKKIKKKCSPLSQTIILRVPLNYYLNNAKSKYYSTAAKYLMYLTEISFRVDDWKGVQSHDDYYSELYQKHFRKKAFWSYFDFGTI